MHKLLATSLAFLLLATSLPAQTPSPTLIPFQGQITNQQGAVYNSGQYTIVFNLYGQAVGGSAIWTERHQKVGVLNGLVNVFLGSISSLGSVDFSQVKYLGITIDADDNTSTADPEMVPRQMIIPAFFAKSAEKMMAFDATTGAPLGQSYGWNAVFNNGNPASGRIPATKLVDASVAATQLATNAVTTAKISDTSVTTVKIADGAITETKLGSDSVSFQKLKAGAVQGNRLADGAVTAAKIEAGAITNAALALDAVSSNKIIDGAIQKADLIAALQQALVPAGTILSFGGNQVPAGYLLCDGRVLNPSDPTYTALFQAIGVAWGGNGTTTFNVPDLRGHFLRGRDGGAARDPNRASRTISNPGGQSGDNVGSVQSDAFQGHRHYLVQPGGEGGPWPGAYNEFITNNNGIVKTSGQSGEPITDGVNGAPRVSPETRPINAYVNYIIKF